MQLILNGKMRAVKNAKTNKWWVSATDFIASLRNADYDTARNYWKQYKHGMKKQNSSLFNYTYQLKMPAKDGRMRYTDVIDFAAMTAILHRMRKTPENIVYLPCFEKWESLLIDMSRIYKSFQKIYMARTYTKEFVMTNTQLSAGCL